MSVLGVIAWAGGAGGTFALFSKFDDLANYNTKRDMSALLRRNPALAATAQWPAIFKRLFDRVYGNRYFSWRFLIVSLITSFVAVLFFAAARHELYPKVRQNYELSLESLIAGIILISVPLDMIGLLKSRAIMSIINASNALWLIMVDFLASLIISISGIHLLQVITGTPVPLSFLVEHYGELLTTDPQAPILWSTVTTSAWAATFYLALVLLRSSSKTLSLINRFLDVETKPFSAVGVAASALVFVISGLAAIIAHA